MILPNMIYCTLYRDPEFGYGTVNPDRTNILRVSLFYLCQMVLSIFQPRLSSVNPDIFYPHQAASSACIPYITQIKQRQILTILKPHQAASTTYSSVLQPHHAASTTYRTLATSSCVNYIPYFSHIKPRQLHTILFQRQLLGRSNG